MLRPRSRLATSTRCAAIALVWLAGCAASTPRPDEPALAQQAQRMRALSAEQIAAEEVRLARSDARDAPLLRALLLAAPNHPRRDEPAALHALRSLAAPAAAQPQALRDAAQLLELWLQTQDRLDALEQDDLVRRAADERRIDRLEGRTREAERRLQDAERRAIEAERRAADSDRRAMDAEHKLEALRTIEREMSHRKPEIR
jgi:hypothetical protein